MVDFCDFEKCFISVNGVNFAEFDDFRDSVDVVDVAVTDEDGVEFAYAVVSLKMGR